jgi:mannose-6-phosphate isomerase-like protein (cupin superfamily)/DNA-binding XRE family transcriptional regulator
MPMTPASPTGSKSAATRRSVDEGLGWRLRTARESMNIGLRELARRIGVSPSLISQIETGKSEPSVSTLMAIVTELGLPVNEIVFGPRESADATGAGPPVGPDTAVASGPARRPGAARARRMSVAIQRGQGLPPWESGEDNATTAVQRASGRRAIDLETGVRWERLTSAPDHDVDFLHVHYEPGGASTPSEALMRHNGREYGYVLSGRLVVSVGFNDYELEPGDSIAFDSTEPHRLATAGDLPAEAIWFVVGRRDEATRTAR